jgi:antitoxin HicB
VSTEIESGRAGQLFEEFLREEDAYDETTERAVKRVLAYQLAEVMRDQHISKVDMAKRLNTSRSQLDRLLDPDNDGVTLTTLARAARAVGRTLRVELT